MPTPEHTRLLTAAARSILRPLGCVQKGRSRTWLDDQGWWVGVVEFQPSAWDRGSYLNVGACWLWEEKDYLSFDVGGRVAGFERFTETAEFASAAQALAEQAAAEVLALRDRFPTPGHVRALMNRHPKTGHPRTHPCGHHCRAGGRLRRGSQALGTGRYGDPPSAMGRCAEATLCRTHAAAAT